MQTNLQRFINLDKKLFYLKCLKINYTDRQPEKKTQSSLARQDTLVTVQLVLVEVYGHVVLAVILDDDIRAARLDTDVANCCSAKWKLRITTSTLLHQVALVTRFVARLRGSKAM